MTETQRFVDRDVAGWITIDFLPGVTLLPLAQPVQDGSIHRARLTQGRRCPAGTFWITPAGTKQGPHVAVTDAELLTVRLGAMGPFGEQP